MMGEEEGEGLFIVSWNINGIRSLNMRDVLYKSFPLRRPSILAVQETKSTRNQLEEDQALVEGYTSYFAFSKNRAGYSGVATYCSSACCPYRAEEGLGGTNLDAEYKESSQAVGSYYELEEEEYGDAKFGDNDGRCVITQHKVQEPSGEERLLNVINVYCPRLRDDPADPVNNRQFKLIFHNIMSERAKKMVEEGQFVLIVGDFNVSHRLIDQAYFGEEKMFIKDEYREWLDELLAETEDDIGFKDTFRMINPHLSNAFTCWNTKLNCRENNYGARIDYIIADLTLSKYLKDASVHQDIMGSDHCPISATFRSLRLITSNTVPNFATKFYPEFSGKQQKILDMFKKKDFSDSVSSSLNTATNKGKLAAEPHSSRKRVAQGPKQTSLTSFLVKKSKSDSSSSAGGNGQISMQMEADLSFNQVAATSTTSVTTGNSGFYQEINSKATAAWRQLLKTPETPLCSGHNERCILRTVKKQGIHKGRQFWACPRGTGRTGDPNSNCNFFKWANSK